MCIALCAIVCFTACTKKDPTPATPTPTAEPTPASPPDSTDDTSAEPNLREIYYDGTYEVGVDIPASTYFALTDWGLAAKLIVKDASGSIAMEDEFTRFSIIVLEEGTSVEVIKCGIVDISQTKDHVRSLFTSGIPDGAYLVGFHISPGVYSFAPYDGYTGARYAIYSDVTRATLIEAADIEADTDATITLEDGQVIFIYYAHMRSCS